VARLNDRCRSRSERGIILESPGGVKGRVHCSQRERSVDLQRQVRHGLDFVDPQVRHPPVGFEKADRDPY
jgi:hypothetical protein